MPRFMDRLEYGPACEYISLNPQECEIYAGCGWYLVAVKQAQIVEIYPLDHGLSEKEIISGNFTEYFNQAIMPWFQKHADEEIYVGTMSCCTFCMPEPIASVLGFAKLARILGEIYREEYERLTK